MDIDHRSKIPLFAVIICIPFLITGIIWISSISTNAQSAKEEVRGILQLVLDIRDRVIRIEERQIKQNK